MSFVIGVLIAVVQAYFFVLLARVVLDIVEMTAQDWRPSGVGLLATNAVYRLTDPPLRFLGRFIPPLRIGAIALDLGFIVLILALWLRARGADGRVGPSSGSRLRPGPFRRGIPPNPDRISQKLELEFSRPFRGKLPFVLFAQREDHHSHGEHRYQFRVAYL